MAGQRPTADDKDKIKWTRYSETKLFTILDCFNSKSLFDLNPLLEIIIRNKGKLSWNNLKSIPKPSAT